MNITKPHQFDNGSIIRSVTGCWVLWLASQAIQLPNSSPWRRAINNRPFVFLLLVLHSNSTPDILSNAAVYLQASFITPIMGLSYQRQHILEEAFLLQSFYTLCGAAGGGGRMVLKGKLLCRFTTSCCAIKPLYPFMPLNSATPRIYFSQLN